MDDVYCALCGVVFSIYAELYDGRLKENDVAWTTYYRACRYMGLGDAQVVALTKSNTSETQRPRNANH